MDNPAQESLSTDQAAEVFNNILSTKEPEVNAKGEGEDVIEAVVEDAKPEEVEAKTEEEPQKFTIKVDGKDVEVTETELADAYKNGLRQSDYTKKTMEVAESRKAAEAEIVKAREERNNYSQKLQEQTVILKNALQVQSKIDWQQLLDADPIEYLKQQHLYTQRQAAFQEAQKEQSVILEQRQQEEAEYAKKFVSQQQEELLAKLPEWKDDKKAESEKNAIRDYLKDNGFQDDEIGRVADHRQVILSRKAMLYDQIMSKAQAAAKKVSTLPTKVERPGGGTTQPLDKRGAAYQRLSKSGSIEDAAAVFSSIL